MIEFVRGDIFECPDNVLVNPVNCVGVMGAGLAKQFKERYPDNYAHYRAMCRPGPWGDGLRPGEFVLYEKDSVVIVNLATKNHWRESSSVQYIEDGMELLCGWLDTRPDLLGVSIPALGCGLGGLEWRIVKEVIRKHAESMCRKEARLRVYVPT